MIAFAKKETRINNEVSEMSKLFEKMKNERIAKSHTEKQAEKIQELENLIQNHKIKEQETQSKFEEASKFGTKQVWNIKGVWRKAARVFKGLVEAYKYIRPIELNIEKEFINTKDDSKRTSKDEIIQEFKDQKIAGVVPIKMTSLYPETFLNNVKKDVIALLNHRLMNITGLKFTIEAKVLYEKYTINKDGSVHTDKSETYFKSNLITAINSKSVSSSVEKEISNLSEKITKSQSSGWCIDFNSSMQILVNMNL